MSANGDARKRIDAMHNSCHVIVYLMVSLFLGCGGYQTEQVAAEKQAAVAATLAFGIDDDFSGKLTSEQESSIPKTLRGAYYIETLRRITKRELEQALKSKELVAEETRDGKRVVAIKDYRHVQFSENLSGQMVVIERYVVTSD